MLLKNRKINPFASSEQKIDKLENAHYRQSWAEENMPTVQTKETVKETFNRANIFIFSAVIFVMIGLIIAKTAWLQILKGDYYYDLAQGNRLRVERIEPKRGLIYDTKNQALVKNIANFLLYFIPSDLPKDDFELSNIINKISQTINISATDIETTLKTVPKNSLESYQPLFIKDSIPYDEAIKLHLEKENWPGVFIASRTHRSYDLNKIQSLSHILGYTGKINPDELKKIGNEYEPIDYIGKTGIEYFWEPELRGVSGEKQTEVDALGNIKKTINQKKAIDGNSIILSIDFSLQKKTEEILSNALKDKKLKKAVAVAMNPNNGEILAMISLPAYDNNAFAYGISADDYKKLINDPFMPLFNRAISGEYPSGSTIKPIILSAALKEKIVTPQTAFLSNGGLQIKEWFFPDWKAGGHGMTNAYKALAESVNTYFYYIGGGYENFRGLGVEKITYYEKLFGLGAQTGIDLKGEATGFLPSPEWKESIKKESWYIGDTYHISIGQGDTTVTPLQVAMYTSFFANFGNLYRPHLAKTIIGSDGKIISNIDTTPIRQNFIDQKNIQIVRDGMRMAVTGGSARRLNLMKTTSAGKTGTAQWSTKAAPHAWFTGFAPFENPEIVLTIIIEEGEEGSATAVPVALDIFRWYFGEEIKTQASSTPNNP